MFFRRDGAPLPELELAFPMKSLIQPIEASSTAVRGALAALARGEEADPTALGLLPARALDYILRHGNPYAGQAVE